MSGRIPTWLAEWLGATLGGDADAATWQLDTAWHWAPWLTILVVLGAIGWTVWLYAHESTSANRRYRALLIGLRLASLAILLVMLAQWAFALRVTGRPLVALVIDRSASMGIADRYDRAEVAAALQQRLAKGRRVEQTRLEIAKRLLTDTDVGLLQALVERYRLAVYFVARGIERHSGAPDSNELAGAIDDLSADGPESAGTRLGDAVRHVLSDLRGAPPTAVILLTDGVTTEGIPLADAALDARRSGVPLVMVGLGSQHPLRDIELADVLVDDAVFVDDLVSVQAQIKATGLEGQSATITLRRAARPGPTGSDSESTVVAEQEIALPKAAETLTVQLVDRPTKAGQASYTVEIAPREDETNQQNNHQERTVAVRDEKIRVLLVQAYPSYEYRYLKSLLERDRYIELHSYLQDADPEFAEQDKTALKAFPLGRDELFAYDVLVIGDVDPRLLPRSVWQNVSAFVSEKGGGIALIAGSRYLPWLYRDIDNIKSLLPFDDDNLTTMSGARLPDAVTRGFVVRPTPVGLQHPVLQLGDSPDKTEQIWQNLAPLYWLLDARALKPAAQVWAVGPRTANGGIDVQHEAGNSPAAIPAICFQFVGAGRVLFHAIDSTWRWRLGAGDVYFARYWLQALRFLARGKLAGRGGVQLSADRREYRSDDRVTLRARVYETKLLPPGGNVIVLVDAAGQTRRRVVLHSNPGADAVFEATLGNLPPGSYQVVLAEPHVPANPPAAQFTVVTPPGELARVEMDAKALAAAAETSRGRFYTLANADRLLAELPAGRRTPLDTLPPIPLWNRWWLVVVLLTCLTSEWILRKRKGML